MRYSDETAWLPSHRTARNTSDTCAVAPHRGREHGGAEALLTITNVLIVLGFREAMTNPNYTTSGSKYGSAPKIVAGAGAALFAVVCAFGTKLGFEAHSPFLFGAGNLPAETVLSLPFGKTPLQLLLSYPMRLH